MVTFAKIDRFFNKAVIIAVASNTGSRSLQAAFVHVPKSLLGDLFRGDISRGFAGLDCCGDHGCCDLWRYPEIEDVRHDEIGVEFVRLHHIGEGASCVQQHSQADIARTGFQQSPEEPWEHQRRIQHICVIRATRCHDLCTTGASEFWRDFRSRYCHGEHNRIIRHAPDHIVGDDIASAEADKHIGILQHLRQRSLALFLICFLGNIRLCPVHAIRTVVVDGSCTIAHHQVLCPGAGEKARHTDAGDASTT